jgi:hypothetical protein
MDNLPSGHGKSSADSPSTIAFFYPQKRFFLERKVINVALCHLSVFPGQAQVYGVELAAGGQFAVVAQEQRRAFGGKEGQSRAEI